MRVAALATALLALAGCTTSKPLAYKEHAVELNGVPFFAQERYQCGPAALATVLVYSDVDTTPEKLVPLVYVPGRKGSFQAELKAATRSAERLPYEISGSPGALLDEVTAGNPVLVLQNLGLSWLPQWHYAVVIGYDPASDNILLRSGTDQRREENTSRFLYSWQLAGNWALVILRPGQLPATASADGYINTLAASEGHVSAGNYELALAAGMRAFPGNADMLFAAANHARMVNDSLAAGEYYREALALNPDHAGALNNYADLLLAESCFASAREMAGVARRRLEPSSPLYTTVLGTSQEIAAAASAGKLKDSGELCAELTGTGEKPGSR